jgi:hypothetical protein
MFKKDETQDTHENVRAALREWRRASALQRDRAIAGAMLRVRGLTRRGADSRHWRYVLVASAAVVLVCVGLSAVFIARDGSVRFDRRPAVAAKALEGDPRSAFAASAGAGDSLRIAIAAARPGATVRVDGGVIGEAMLIDKPMQLIAGTVSDRGLATLEREAPKS